MIKQKTHKLHIALVLVLVLGLFTGVILGFSGDKKASAEFSGGEIKPLYLVGETLNVPEASFTSDGKKVKAESVVYFPDGSGYLTDSVEISQMGNYTVLYRAEINNNLHTKEVSFFADQSLYTVSSKDSSASYGKDNSDYKTALKGIRLSLAENDSFMFNKVIDLNKCSATNPAFKFYALPEVQGKIEARYVYIDFIDIYDPENVVSVLVKGSAGTGNTIEDMAWQYTYAYVMAKAPGQIYTGIEGTKIHRGNIYGMPCNFSLYGMGLDIESNSYGTGKGSVDSQFFAVYLDGSAVRTNNVYGGGTIVDLNNREYQPTGWNGFTTGEVYVKMYTANPVKSNANYIITNIAGADLSGESVDDNEGPAITIDSNGLDLENLPNGAKGYSYPVFDAEANDTYSGKVRVSTRVFFNYYSSTRYELNISSGRFSTAEVGNYSIVYTATDRVGNETKIVLPVTVLENANPLSIVTETNPEVTALRGNVVSLAKVLNYSGGNGTVKTGYDITVGGKKAELYTKDSFIPESVGDYAVSAYVEDTIGNRAEYKYKVVVSTNPSPSIIGDVKLPEYILEGFNYTLPKLNAIDYNNNKAVVSTTVSVTDGSGTRDCPSGVPVSFVADKDGYAVVRYTSGVNKKEYKVPVISVRDEDGFHMEKYFISDTADITAEDGSLRLETTKSGKSNTRFVKEIMAENVVLRYSVDKNSRNFGEVSFVLTDYLDSSVKLVLTQKFSSSYLYVNGEQTAVKLLGTEFNDVANNLVFDNNDILVGDGLGSLVSVKKSGFNGFPSGLVNIDIELGEVTGKSAVNIIMFNKQPFGLVSDDNVAPELKVLSGYDLVRSKGTNVTVARAIVSDILDPDVYAEVSVTYKAPSPDDDENAPKIPEVSVMSTNGILLTGVSVDKEYTFTLNDYGEYFIRYKAVDSTGKVVILPYKIRVLDEVAPEITLKKAVTSTGKVGKKINLPQATVKDNVDEGLTAKISVTDPGGKIMTCKDNYFIPKIAGVYTVKYLAIDSTGNVASKVFTITVK